MDIQPKSGHYGLFSSAHKSSTAKPKGLSLKKLPSTKDITVYTELLLNEYHSLVDSMSSLDEKSFYTIHSEVNSIVDKLIKWFEETSPSNTLSIYWSLRRLKQKVEQNKKNIINND